MSKRRRTSSIASRGPEDDFEDASTNSGPTVRKKRKSDPSETCQHIYDLIRNFKKEDGGLLCDSFIRAPKRRQEPGYYDVVSNPIDMLKIQQKLKTDEYEDPEELTMDVELMIKNAKAFYKKTSQEYKDACDLWELFLSTKTRMVEEEEAKVKVVERRGRKRNPTPLDRSKSDIDIPEDISESSTNPDDDYSQYEDLFTAVMMATDLENRPLHVPFQLLPSKKKYPEYYEVIENPIDLKTIAQKIQNNEYTSLTELEKDLIMLCRNACLFNEPGSQIYKDAKALKKIISSKKIEVEHGKLNLSGKSSERIRNKRMRGGIQTLSAVTAALKDEESDTDMEDQQDEDVDLFDPEDPMWQLFAAVRNTVNASGSPMSDPFWKLPSKRYYPDYYKEIKNPVSLSQIRSKLKKGDYGTVSEVAGDMNIMFENAKKYNVHTSKLYKDAAKLQKIMQAKVQELLDIDQDTDSDAESEDSHGLKRRKRQSTPIAAGRKGPNVSLKRRLHAISKSLIDYTCEEGRQPMLLFMEKPSKKLYPDYYQVISQPIDVLTIEANIKNEKYQSEEELISDFKLMFANCRHYNEEGSMIYNDANLLEKVLMEKANIAQPTPTPDPNPRKYVARTIRPRKHLSPDEQKLRGLYDTIRDFREPKSDRQLALIFMKLPSKNDYPDYYEVIKEPIDMEMIAAKLKSSLYDNLDKMVADFILMFDNACKYNEPDSQIYKDALILQRVCLQTKQKLRENDAEDNTPPDVQAAVQDLLATLFLTVYNHQDDEGRCYSDSMAELTEHDEIDGKKVRALSLDLIKRRLDRGVYRRLDTFQDDFFACLDRARRLSRTDSQVFEDSIELQSYFIRQRDELCGCGDLLQSPALSYTISDLIETIDKSKRDKIKQEIPDEEGDSTSTSRTSVPKENVGDSMTCNQRTFRVGEFIYIDSKEKGVDPSIILIERLWTNSEGQQMLYGNYFLRPGETYHVTTRKFLENEVFKSDAHVAAPLNEVKDRCCVLNIKDYMKFKPEGYADKDVYVCESRYSTKARSFKKIKVWPVPEGVVNLIERAEPFELRRVMSVFRERVEKHKDELAELAEQENLVEREKPNVVAFNMMGQVDDGNVYYEQYNTICSGVVKTGDFVYVATEDGRQLIAQIDAIWETKCGKCFYRGPWLIPPSEIPHLATRMFYRQEVFLSTTESVSPLVGIVGKCSVLEFTDYISCRLTEIPETDVYVCESLFDEVKRTITKLSTEGLKRYSHSPSVTEDETYFFRRLINPQKETFEVPPGLILPQVIKVEPVKVEIKQEHSESSPATPKISADDMMEDSLDGGPPSVGSGEIPTPMISAISTPMAGLSSTPVSAKKQKVPGKKIVTGYILYSSEVRKTVAQNNPESGFGEISRIVGNEWRSLPAGEKQAWEEKAQKINEEAANEAGIPVVRPPPPPTQPPDFVYECQWDDCDLQFEDLNDCLDHCVQEGAGHIQLHFQGVKDPEFQCHWRGCIRIKKQAPSFPHLQRLARHVREVHIMKGNGKVIPVAERSKNFVPSKKQAAAASQQAAEAAAAKTVIQNRVQQSVTPHYAPQVPRPVEPLFITVPPRPTRILHSEAYIKYIEGLQATNKFMSPWEKTLNASEENTPVPDSTKLPGHWLANGERNHASLTSALWSLRDLMMRDIMSLAKN